MIVEFTSPQDFVSNLKAALNATSEDLTRPYLNAVKMAFRDNVARFIATNGHWVWINEERTRGEGSADLLISSAELKRIIKQIDCSKKATSCAVEIDTEAKTVRQQSTTVGFVVVDAHFPSYSQIIPASVGAKRVDVGLAAEYLADVAAAFNTVCKKGKNGPGLVFEAGDKELDPVVVTAEDCPDALVVIMPRRDRHAGGSAALRARYRALEVKAKAA